MRQLEKNDKKSDEMKRERMQSEKREERTGEERIRKENSSLKKNERMEWKLDYKKKVWNVSTAHHLC